MKTADELLLPGRLKSMDLVGNAKGIRRLGKIVFILLLLFIPCVLFLPWLQTTSGSGRIIAFDPLDRKSEIQAQVSGRVGHLHVVEGQAVKAGDLIAVIEANDPELLARLDIQILAQENNLSSIKRRQEDYREKLKQKQQGLKRALEVEDQKIEAANAEMAFAEQDFTRKERLYKDGLVSAMDYQKAEASKQKAVSKVAESVASKQKVTAEIEGELADIRASINKEDGEVAKIEKEIADLQSKRASSARLSVTAPRDGIVTAISTNDGQYLSPGSPICTVIPQSSKRFVEAAIDANYIPLLKARKVDDQGEILEHGSMVRLQFEGWPAIQFSGWPNVAVGTFGGEVVFIDEHDDGTGKFRIIITPEDVEDPNNVRSDDEWPESKLLRQGVRAKTWVQIQQVPLWQELWRRFNGFPPAVPNADSVAKDAKAKKKSK